jgi:hypothetical protein
LYSFEDGWLLLTFWKPWQDKNDELKSAYPFKAQYQNPKSFIAAFKKIPEFVSHKTGNSE